MYTLVGIFNLGWITNFISHSVISGFMSGAAVIIGLSQVSSCIVMRRKKTFIDQCENLEDAINVSAIQRSFTLGLMNANYASAHHFLFTRTGMPKLLLVQVKSIFGYQSRPNPGNSPILKLPSLSFPRHDPVYEQLGDLFGSTWTPYFQWRELVMGLCWIGLLLTMKHIGNLHRYQPLASRQI